MLETVVLLNIFWDLWYLKKNKKLKRTVFIQNRDFVTIYTIQKFGVRIFFSFFLFKDTLKKFKES